MSLFSKLFRYRPSWRLVRKREGSEVAAEAAQLSLRRVALLPIGVLGHRLDQAPTTTTTNGSARATCLLARGRDFHVPPHASALPARVPPCAHAHGARVPPFAHARGAQLALDQSPCRTPAVEYRRLITIVRLERHAPLRCGQRHRSADQCPKEQTRECGCDTYRAAASTPAHIEASLCQGGVFGRGGVSRLAPSW